MEELVSLSQLDEGQIRELFSMAVRNGSVEKHLQIMVDLINLMRPTEVSLFGGIHALRK